ncbi:hypothetical protein Dimus_000728 [Dionaea muscipula]
MFSAESSSQQASTTSANSFTYLPSRTWLSWLRTRIASSMGFAMEPSNKSWTLQSSSVKRGFSHEDSEGLSGPSGRVGWAGLGSLIVDLNDDVSWLLLVLTVTASAFGEILAITLFYYSSIALFPFHLLLETIYSLFLRPLSMNAAFDQDTKTGKTNKHDYSLKHSIYFNIREQMTGHNTNKLG